jgi:hypothetical protein
MAERETTEIITPANHNLVVKTYVTARESLPALGDENKTAVDKTNALAQAIIVSIDGVAENILDLLLDLPLPDYAFTIAKVKEIADGNFQQTK